MGELLLLFWEEFDDFQIKEGKFKDREHIWNAQELKNGNSHLWHKKFSLPYTVILGKVACRVCSKIIGIGSAERSWGDVKQLKQGKRSHLSAERIKKQATIFGSWCIERAQIRRNYRYEGGEKPFRFWTEEDFDDEFDMLAIKDRLESKDKAQRMFRNWEEDWEKESVRKRDIISEVRLLEKYGGLQMEDLDNHNVLVTLSSKSLLWRRLTAKGGGYHVNVLDGGYDSDDEGKDDHVEPWEIGEDLRYSIAEYYKKCKDKGVVILDEDADADGDEDNNED